MIYEETRELVYKALLTQVVAISLPTVFSDEGVPPEVVGRALIELEKMLGISLPPSLMYSRDTVDLIEKVHSITRDIQEYTTNGTHRIDNDKLDVYTHISNATGLDRNLVKELVYKLIHNYKTLPELLREYKVPLMKLAHLITEFDNWTGAE